MPNGKRKVPFSCKRKKEQLILKRQINKSLNFTCDSDSNGDSDCEIDYKVHLTNVQSFNRQPSTSVQGNIRNPNRYNLQFKAESKKELDRKKKDSWEPIKVLEHAANEIDDSYFRGYDFPKRPKWYQGISKEELTRNENRYFKEYIDEIMKKHTEVSNTSIFELNLETWRQLWRVIEISDILLVVVDARFPSLMFPPSLFDYLKNTLKKNIILLLNKIDLISAESVLAWKNYFKEKYPGIHIVFFASYTRKSQQNKNYYIKKKSLFSLESTQKIYEICKGIVSGSDINLDTWEQKILEDSQNSDDKLQITHNYVEESTTVSTEVFETENNTKFKNNILTIGSIGFPNAGKSTVINSLKGCKVVSVSKTPGHTKHFQTIFLTHNVKLCDSPGLVFPSRTPKYLQVLIGSFPIAQLKDPYHSLIYVCERIDLIKALNIELPSDFQEWSAIAVCEAWCLKRGFLTAKASRPDHYRAANNLLRMILEGKIVIASYAPGFQKNREQLLKEIEELQQIRRCQGYEKLNEEVNEQSSSDNSESGDDITREKSESDGNECDNDDVGQTKVKHENLFNLLDSD